MNEMRRSLNNLQKTLYDRNIRIPEIGESGQLKLLDSRVLIVGLGGLASPALLYLAAAGIGEIGILDSDRVELSNLQRQILHCRGDIGTNKTESARQRIEKLNPDIRVKVYPLRLLATNAATIIVEYDFIIEATDNFESKFLINDVCVQQNKPYSHAGVLGMYGQTLTVVPGQGPCFRCIAGDIPPPQAIETTEKLGVLGTVPGVFGAIQATEAIKYLTGCGDLLIGRLLTWNALTATFKELKVPIHQRCNICADL